MISDGIKRALKDAANAGTTQEMGKPVYAVKLSFDQLIALIDRVDEWNVSQNRD